MTRAVLERDADQFVYLHGLSWEAFETILELRGDSSSPKLAYIDGELEIMSPSWGHEWKKKTWAQLVEAYRLEMGIELTGVGSMTLRKEIETAGAEPDECYVLGSEETSTPDLALEVIWTSGGLDKLEIYRRLGVGEVWYWLDGKIRVHVLRGTRYRRVARSVLFPELDLALMELALQGTNQTEAVRAFLASVRKGRGRRR